MLLSACVTTYLVSWLILRPASGYEEPGLYDDSHEVVYLDHENFYNVVLNSRRAWLVQFYNSWCGHCMDFAPVYQEFARNVSRWRPAVGIAAINCADEKNIAVCRANKVEAYPTMKAGPPYATNTTDFTKVTVKVRTPALLIEMLLKYLLSIPHHFPRLHPIGTVDKMWEILDAHKGPLLQSATFLLEEGPDSYIGSRIIMDTFGGTGLTVFRNVNSDLTDVQIQSVDAKSKTLTTIAKNLKTYEEVAAVLHPHLLMTNDSLAAYIITRKPRATVPPVEVQRAFTDEEIMEQVAVLRASRKNISTTQQYRNGTSTIIPIYVASLEQRGFLVTMEEYREAVVIAWRKRIHGEPLISNLSTTQLTTHANNPSSNAATAVPAITSSQPSYSALRHIIDLIVPKNLASPPAPVVPVNGGNGGAAASVQPVAHDVPLQLDVVQLSDLLFAVRKSVGYEIPLRLHDDDASQMAAAKQYVKVLAEFLPCPASYRSSLHCLDERLDALPQVTSAKWIVLLQECQLKDQLDRDSALASCKGSTSRYRGYPCTMWTMFHTLTVAEADVASRLPKGWLSRSRVLIAMRDYLGSFFGCSECSHNFVAMAAALNLTAAAVGDESILWLWTAHNHANARLRGARSEDPEHRKQQYPPVELCATCFQTAGNNGSQAWSVDNVVSYLKSHYSWSSIVGLPGQPVEQPPVPSLPAPPGGSTLPKALPGRGGELFDRLKAVAESSTRRGSDPERQPSAATAASAAPPRGDGLVVAAAAGGHPRQRLAARKQSSAAEPSQQQRQEAAAPVLAEQPRPAAAVVAGSSRFPFRTHELHKRDAERLRDAAAINFFHSFSSSDLAVIALLYTLCGLFIAVFYYHFVVAKRMRIKIM